MKCIKNKGKDKYDIIWRKCYFVCTKLSNLLKEKHSSKNSEITHLSLNIAPDHAGVGPAVVLRG